jgi:hypothetical protein
MTDKTYWLQAPDEQVAAQVGDRVSAAVLLVNGTRRWFLSQQADWSHYPQATGAAHRRVSQLLYEHGIANVIQPLFGFDLLERGQEYLELALQQGLASLAGDAYLAWYRQADIRVIFYGNWRDTLSSLGFHALRGQLDGVVDATAGHARRRLLVGLFADRPWDDILALSRRCRTGRELVEGYYGLPLPPIDLVIGSGQPAVWDVPLLDTNRASLYFMQAPTFFMSRETLRLILYDHLFERSADDQVTALPADGFAWMPHAVLGVGQRTALGWIPV